MLPNEDRRPFLIKNEKRYSLVKSIKSLKKNPREFWLMYLLEFILITPFNNVFTFNTLYLTRILLFTNIQSGIIIGSYGLAVGVLTVIFSSVPGRFGFRLSIYISISLGILFNILSCLHFDRYIQISLYITLFIPSLAIITISLKLSVKQYSYPKNRSVGYSIFYMIYYISGGITGILVDSVLYERTTQFESYREIMYMNIGGFALAFLIASIMRNLDISESGEKELEHDKGKSGWKYLMEAFSTRRFWKFFLLIILLTIIKSMYFHLGTTLPLFVKRDYGEHIHFGMLMGVHNGVLLLFIPLLTALIRCYDFYTLLIIGSTTTALSPLVLFIEDSFNMLYVFIIILSLGEAIYAPRIVDLTLASSPKGKEAIYIGLSSMPNSLGLIITGISSGLLMNTYCPAAGAKYCFWVWIYIGGYCSFVCLILVIFKRKFLN